MSHHFKLSLFSTKKMGKMGHPNVYKTHISIYIKLKQNTVFLYTNFIHSIEKYFHYIFIKLVKYFQIEFVESRFKKKKVYKKHCLENGHNVAHPRCVYMLCAIIFFCHSYDMMAHIKW